MVFERGADGYHATPAGQQLIAAARRAEQSIEGVRQQLDRADIPAGPLRITTTDLLYDALLAPILAEFGRRHPRVCIELDLSNTVHDLARRTADVAIRPSNTPAEHLVGRRLGTLTQAVYRAVDDPSDTATPRWVAPSTAMGYGALARWMAGTVDDAAIATRVNSGLAARAAALAGVGQAVLPCYAGAAEPGLQRVSPVIDVLSIDLWLLIRPDARATPTMRALVPFVAERTRARLTA
ncbi:LysR family transcriptional regulator [Salinisphaera sp. Q1T1-3]|uniref:LysR family transcriptional regulator n=1 Tax=Salinisphaera sp. Q1T1-3 TaxID=2321229 RepID=UPI0013149C5B|nr:LysR family transcriptional regulator [Salinisphaera sp. Q1T1-3]